MEKIDDRTRVYKKALEHIAYGQLDDYEVVDVALNALEERDRSKLQCNPEVARCDRCDHMISWIPNMEDPDLPADWARVEWYFGLTMLSGPRAGQDGVGVEVFSLCPTCVESAVSEESS